MHGVIVHVCPDQSFELEHSPHGFVGVSDFAADGPMSSSFAELLKGCFDLVSHVEVETGAGGGRDGDHLAGVIRR